MMVVGLTGGIASGKSIAAERFAELGAEVIDTDRIAREVVRPGSPGLRALVEAFGRGILDPQGGLDRRRLRDLVFSDAQARDRLETTLHPLIERESTARIRRSTAAYVVLVVPLLVEKGWDRLVDRVLVVDVDEQTQQQRLMDRDSTEPREARAIIRAQATRDRRLALADDVLVNDGSAADLRAGVDSLHRRYLEMAAAG